MTIADLLYQAGPWQWVGIIILTWYVCDGVAKIIKACTSKGGE